MVGEVEDCNFLKTGKYFFLFSEMHVDLEEYVAKNMVTVKSTPENIQIQRNAENCSIIELTENIQRLENTLSNKKLLEILPDKGEKLNRRHEIFIAELKSGLSHHGKKF